MLQSRGAERSRKLLRGCTALGLSCFSAHDRSCFTAGAWVLRSVRACAELSRTAGAYTAPE